MSVQKLAKNNLSVMGTIKVFGAYSEIIQEDENCDGIDCLADSRLEKFGNYPKGSK